MSGFLSSLLRIFRSKPIKFLFAGLVNTAFGYISYAVLIYFGLPYLLALLIATIIGIIFNFFNFSRFVFNERSTRYIFLKFIAAYILIYLVNSIVLIFLTREFLFDPYLGQVICIPLSVVLSWLLMKNWVYR